MKNGVLAEKTILDELQQELKNNDNSANSIVARGNQAAIKYKTIQIIPCWQLVVGGRPDGIVLNGNNNSSSEKGQDEISISLQDSTEKKVTSVSEEKVKASAGAAVMIVEVKKRQNHLFRSVPDYEFIQIQLYMWIFDAKKCLFREKYNDESWSVTIDYDPICVNLIKQKLVDFGNRCLTTFFFRHTATASAVST
jgi:hypothetical protein